ncbi:unnamed protein product [Heligmosomoides polygyrus]|uniref:Uncharacterized protein n=1 Tax=Heligmosomoides polygyrus TaxID=6339 RepID=A0A183GPR4_HELPZ|nr:unnamed protein product [Heligmosomoides polygyrus]
MDRSLDEYKAEILQAVAETHERVREYNEKVRKQMKRRGAVIGSAADKGHLQFACKEDCFAKATLADIAGVSFPGAYGRQPFGNVWSAWRTASIFIRTDVTVAEKIRLNREKVVALDVVALKSILRVAYELCTDWTEFICTHATIEKHPTIENNCIRDFYKIAFEDLKEELKQQCRAARQRKLGPVGFAAPETAHLMEKDGPRGGLITKVSTTFSQLKDILEDWSTLGTWIIVYPIECRGEKAVIEGVVKLAKKHVEEGGVVVTAWTPVTSQNAVKWSAMIRLWTAMDAVLSRYGGPDHVITTASNVLVDGRVFLEIGTPEASAQFYKPFTGVAAAKQLYECIRLKAPQVKLPALQERSMRPSTTERGGVSERDAGRSYRVPLKRRAQ